MRTLLLGLTLMGFALSTTSCTVPVDETIALSVRTLPGVPVGSVLTGVQTQTLPAFTGSFSKPSFNHGISIQALALRSVLDDPSDQSDSALKDTGLVDQCPEGRAHLGFIQAVQVKIRHQSQTDDQAVLVASYQKSGDSDPCGINLDTQDVDISDYLGDYAFVTTVTATLPPSDVKIGGYAIVEAREGL